MPKAPTSPLPPRRREAPERGAIEPAPGAFVIDDEAGICKHLPIALGQLGLAAESFHTAATRLRIHGIALGIGAGFSSFERLRELPFSELKLHPGFVAGCATDDKNAGICRAAIDLAHRFDILTVAAGLESEGDLCALRDLGCDIGQGPLFTEPMPKSQLMNVLGERARTKHACTG